MNNIFILILLCLVRFTFLLGHEGHKNVDENKSVNESLQISEASSGVKQYEGRPKSWMEWVGGFHFTFLHFPIALIGMTVISEMLFVLYTNPIFDHAARFMLISAAILAVPTALLGLIYSYTATYNGILADFVLWHMWFGFTTAIFAIFMAFICAHWGINKLYYICLVLLLLLVNITGFFGGSITFGPYHMYSPL